LFIRAIIEVLCDVKQDIRNLSLGLEEVRAHGYTLAILFKEGCRSLWLKEIARISSLSSRRRYLYQMT